MAIEIKFRGFINEVKRFEWGTVYDISHSQFRKNHQGEWETVGKDYFSVVAPEGMADTFEEGQQVTVMGRMKTKRFDKRDGSKGISLEVRAESIEIWEMKSKSNNVGEAALGAVWDVKPLPIDEEAPF